MYRKYLLLLAVATLLLLLTGSQCTLVISSGDSSDKDKDEEDPPSDTVILVNTGRFIDAPVEGLRYTSGLLGGTTGPSGEFQYEEGNTVQFYIGAHALGMAAPGRPVMTPLDLIEDGTLDSPAVINIARLLQSLDAVPGDARITLPASADEPGRRASEALAPVIEHLDFHDETNFVNTASQVVATLTADYAFTAMLVEAPEARRHLAAALAEAGIPH